MVKFYAGVEVQALSESLQGQMSEFKFFAATFSIKGVKPDSMPYALTQHTRTAHCQLFQSHFIPGNSGSLIDHPDEASRDRQRIDVLAEYPQLLLLCNIVRDPYGERGFSFRAARRLEQTNFCQIRIFCEKTQETDKAELETFDQGFSADGLLDQQIFRDDPESAAKLMNELLICGFFAVKIDVKRGLAQPAGFDDIAHFSAVKSQSGEFAAGMLQQALAGYFASGRLRTVLRLGNAM
jgi:hypothetical protein